MAQEWYHPERDAEERELLQTEAEKEKKEKHQEAETGTETEAEPETEEPVQADDFDSQGWLDAWQELPPPEPRREPETRQERRAARQEEREAQRERQRRSWYVRTVEFKGNETYSRKELTSLMELKPKSWPSDPVRFTNFLLNSDLNVLRSFYRGSGFEYAKVTLNRVDRDTTSRRVRVLINVEEGPRVHVGDVTVASDRYEMGHSEMRRLATKPGVPLIHQNARQDARRIKNTLGQRGFLAASVEPSIDFDSTQNLAHVTFNVTEGPKAVTCKIELEGNKGVRDIVLRRELAFKSGDTLNSRMIRNSERRLYTTGLFGYVHIRPMFDSARLVTELPDSLYNVQVRVSPTEFFSMQSGVGYSTDEGARVSASATYRNMFGLGQGLTVSGKLSQISQGAEAIYVIPWFLFLPFQFDTKVYYTRYDNAELYQGVFDGVRLSLGRLTNYNFLYQVWSQWEQVRWVRAPVDEEIGPAGVPDYPTQSIGWDISYDMRNDLFNPTKGGYTHLGVEVAGVFGGHSNQFVKVTLDNRVYFSRSKYYLSMALRTGWVTPYGESEVVPVQSQFYGGGSTTVRGFPVNKLAVMPNDDPLKGNYYVFANIADVRFPLFWWVNGALFLDAGNVWSDFSEIKSASQLFDDLRWSAGPGLRIDTPIKLVARLDLGFKIDRRTGESKREWHFDLGQPF